jgi:predicted hydrolase (HD superfamily)
MTVPSRREAAAILRSLRPPPRHLRHSCAVADVAAWLARAARAAGHSVDARAIEAAGLLHDVDKVLPAGDPAHRLPHGEGSAAWLRTVGVGELAELVADHPVTRLAGDVAWARLAAAPLEARIVAYADKRAGQRLESMDARFASWRRRYPAGPHEDGRPTGWDDATARLVRARAATLEADVCAAAGIVPEQVGRLRWARRALAEAAGTAERAA